jgi:hypothetical protein
MPYTFISFANTLINTRYIICFEKRTEVVYRVRKFSITVLIEGHSFLNEWYDSEEERNDRCLELETILKVG